MEIALLEAQKAFDAKEVPVGAVVVRDGAVVARAHNLTVSQQNPLKHAELIAIQGACGALNRPYLEDCELYVTLEPCAMCAGAIAHARLARVYFGAYDPKSGGTEHGARVFDHPQSHHKPEVYGGIMEGECAQLLKDFFVHRR